MSAFSIHFRLATVAMAVSLLWALVPDGPAHAATTVYTSRATFLAQLTTQDTDDFSAPGYAHGDSDDEADYDRHTDSHMSAVRGETIFTATAFSNFNFIINSSTNPYYCAGCNGSFRLTFTATSQGGSNGVFGAGFDNLYLPTNDIAFVTFGDMTTQEVSLNGRSFFGITSDKLIRSIHVGLTGGAMTQVENIWIDNLTIGNVCGDASPGGAEDCDDGNANDADCCRNNCTAYASGTPCGSPAVSDCSAADSCDGAGTCSMNNVTAGTSMPSCSDGLVCTFDQCDGNGSCGNPPRAFGSSCADADLCNGDEHCNGGGSCISGTPPNCDDYDLCTQDFCDSLTGCSNDLAPADTCDTGAAASLQVKHDADGGYKSQLKWKLKKGGALDQASLGDPTTTAGFAICVYDESGGVPGLSTMLAMDPTPVWKSADPKGFSFKDSLGFWDGITGIKLKTGEAGKSSVSVTAKGYRVPLAAPANAEKYFAQDGKVTIQLHDTETARCWSSEFSSSSKNSPERFKATAP
ncbi:MAG: hypothetical protein ABR538_04780 [Candidatus Binatia bacterium]